MSVKSMSVCKSCGRSSHKIVSFACPNPACASGKHVRCNNCKENENTYKCDECGFTGP